MAGLTFPVRLQPSYSTQSVLRVIAGPETSRFTSESLADFYTQAYQVSTQSDRMGYRLDGPNIRHTGSADVVSRGMAMGEIQVPGSGQPIVMMADHPTTGGYTSLGAVARVDWPLLAQSSPGEAIIRFTRTTLQESQQQLTQLIHAIVNFQFDQEDQWINF
jgi:allophanate hydrolase subunit 2